MKKFKKALKNTAKNNDTTVKAVKKEISYAISAAMESTELNESGRAFWSELTKSKKRPTPEEVVAALYKKISNFYSSP
ncbi:MAG: hypothetical protein J6C29_06895 [Clostridia bacterium]|nr:hypothetical protein [Clostridia bacterium]